ncbi:hypothetical protein HMPREF9374_3432 [Desmospora sp. 8437]|nr:hypothetical protein HMPREF9374_3432 [Desmospora sp. 8437]
MVFWFGIQLYTCAREVFTQVSGVFTSHILGEKIVFYHAPVAIQQGSNDWPLRIFQSGQGQSLSEVLQGRMLPLNAPPFRFYAG